MEPIYFAFISAVVITMLSLIAAPLLLLKEHILRFLSVFLVALAASALLGTAFFHILPEVMEEGFEKTAFLLTGVGFLVFYVVEKILHLHHVNQRELTQLHRITQAEQEEKEHGPRELGILSASGDFLHNFIDGVILATTFIADIKLGLISSVAVALHEAPQEVAIFGVLIYSGFSKFKAFLLTFFTQTSIILGVSAVLVAKDFIEPRLPFFLLFTLGSFIYLGASDFVPEFRKEKSRKKSLALFLVFLAGLFLIWLLGFLE